MLPENYRTRTYAHVTLAFGGLSGTSKIRTSSLTSARTFTIAIQRGKNYGDTVNVKFSWNPTTRTFTVITSFYRISRLYLSDASPQIPTNKGGSGGGRTSTTQKEISTVYGASSGKVTFRKATRRGFFHGLRLKFPNPGRYDIEVRRTDDETKKDLRTVNTGYITDVQSIIPEAPIVMEGIWQPARRGGGFDGEGLSLYEGRIKSSEQLSGRLNAVNAECEAEIPVYDGTAWAYEVSDNPAWIAVYILRDGPFGLLHTDLDMNAWRRFASYCDSRGYAWNGVMEKNVTKADAIKEVLEVAHAEVVRTGGQYSVMWNDPAEPVCQIFSPRNLSSVNMVMTYVDEIHGMRVSYTDARRDWQVHEVIVYESGYSETNATKFETIDAYGITDRTQAVKYGRWKLAERRLRPLTYSFNSSWDHLVCTRGSRVRLQGYTIGKRICSARVAGMEAGSITPDILPDPGVMENTDYIARISTSGNSGVVMTTVRWHEDESRFLGSIPSGVSLGDHFIVGVSDDDSKEIRIQDIQYSEIGLALISGTDWQVDELHAAEPPGAAIPDYSEYEPTPQVFRSGVEIGTLPPPPDVEMNPINNEVPGGAQAQASISIVYKNIPQNPEDLGVKISLRGYESGHETGLEGSVEESVFTIEGLVSGDIYEVNAYYKRLSDGVLSEPVSQWVVVPEYEYEIPPPNEFSVSERSGLRIYKWKYTNPAERSLVSGLRIEARKRESLEEWAAGVSFMVGDKRRSGGENYICTRNHTSSGSGADGPPIDADSTAWREIPWDRVADDAAHSESPLSSSLPLGLGEFDIRVTPLDNTDAPVEGASEIHRVAFNTELEGVDSVITIHGIPDASAGQDFSTDPALWPANRSGAFFRNNAGLVKVLVARIFKDGEEIPYADYAGYTYQWKKNGNASFTPSLQISGANQVLTNRYLAIGPADVVDGGEDAFSVVISNTAAPPEYRDIRYGWADTNTPDADTISGLASSVSYYSEESATDILDLDATGQMEEAYLIIAIDHAAPLLEGILLGLGAGEPINEISSFTRLEVGTDPNRYNVYRSDRELNTAGVLSVKINKG